jgi:hypothetical protein
MKPISHLKVISNTKNLEDMSYSELQDFQNSLARLYNFTPEDIKELHTPEPAQSTNLPTWAKVTVFICNIAIVLSSITLCFVLAFFIWVIYAAFMR